MTRASQPGRHLAMPGDDFGCHGGGGVVNTTGLKWVEARDADKILQCTGWPRGEDSPQQRTVRSKCQLH